MALVKLRGGLRSKVGAEELEVEADDVRELLDVLVEEGG